MKSLLFPLTIYLMTCLLGCGQENPVVEPPIPNADSIRCVQAWQKFQIPKDTILTLRYQQPVKIRNGTDTMAITVIDIDDFCSEESAKDTYGCDARIKLKVELNGGCTYQTKYPLTISRYGAGGYSVVFKDLNCKVGDTNAIMNGPSAIWSFYNCSIIFRQLLPFALTQSELLQLYSNKQQYKVMLSLQKRCI